MKQNEAYLTDKEWEQVKEHAQHIMAYFNKANVQPALALHTMESISAIALRNLEYMTGVDAISLASDMHTNICTHINELYKHDNDKSNSILN